MHPVCVCVFFFFVCLFLWHLRAFRSFYCHNNNNSNNNNNNNDNNNIFFNNNNVELQ